MPERHIHTTDHNFGWSAVLDGYDGAPDATGIYSIVGSGKTEIEAIENLLERVDDATSPKMVYRVPVAGGAVDTITQDAAFAEAGGSEKWTYKSADEMFRSRPLLKEGETLAPVIQSDRFLYSPSLDSLKRNADRLGIAVTGHTPDPYIVAAGTVGVPAGMSTDEWRKSCQ